VRRDKPTVTGGFAHQSWSSAGHPGRLRA